MLEIKKRRASKNLLVGLGATLATASVVGILAVGLNSLLNQNGSNETNRVNSLASQPIKEMPNFQTATTDMFINPTNLKDFHFGNVRKGQTLTPWGWLGVYDDANERKNIALTSWSGEILWKHEGYGGYGDVYDIQYEFVTDSVFIMRTQNPSGLFLANGQPTANSMQLDVLSGRTGAPKWRWRPNKSDGSVQLGADSFASGAYATLLNNGLIPRGMDNDFATGETWRIKDLYRMQVVANGNKNQLLLTYLPNFMQLYSANNSDGALPNLEEVFKVAAQAGKMWNISLKSPANSRPVNFDLREQIKQANGFYQGDQSKLAVGGGDNYVNLNQAYLLTNPFVTTGSNVLSYWMHLIIGTFDNDRVFHIRWQVNPGSFGVNASSYGTQKLNDKRSGVATPQLVTIDSNSFSKRVKNWAADVIMTAPALLRPAFNMFDPNLVTFAYPYATSDIAKGSNTYKNDWPVYNVAQLKFVQATGLVETSNSLSRGSINYDFGKQILQNFNSNNNTNKGDIVVPWPMVVGNSTNTSPTHNFNRLVAVSPFDNSFIYSSFVGLRNPVSIYRPSNQINSFKGFWLVNSESSAQRTELTPVIISDAAGFGKGAIDVGMTNLKAIEETGFTWDIDSMFNSEVKLFFNQKGSARNSDWGTNGWKSSKIGILKVAQLPPNEYSPSGILGLYDNTGDKRIHSISSNNFGALIHGRADLTKWYNLTQYAIENPMNMMKSGARLNLDKGGTVAVKKFNDKMAVSNRPQELVDVVTHYLPSPLRDSLAIINPKIEIDNDSGGSNTVRVRSLYEINNNNTKTKLKTFFKVEGWPIQWELKQTLTNTSVQVFSKIGTFIKFEDFFDKIGTASAPQHTVRTKEVTAPTWYDVRKITNIKDEWGNVNNNLSNSENKKPLRVMLQLVKPNNGPAWINKFDSRVWTPAPADENRLGTESDFRWTLKLYQQEMMKYINNDDQTQWGIGNLIVRASLELNPLFAKDQKVYQGPTRTNQQILVGKDNSIFLYEDKHTTNETIIYKQIGQNYDEMSKYGFGAAVLNEIKPNWTTVPTNRKFLMDVPLIDVNSASGLGLFKGLAHPVVRRGVSFSDNRPLFRVRLTNGNQQHIILSPTSGEAAEVAWLQNLLTTMNFKYGMFIILEGLINNTWQSVRIDGLPGASHRGTHFSDQELKSFWDSKTKSFKIPTNIGQIEKLRIRLSIRGQEQIAQYPNEYIQWEKQPIANDNYKLLSWEHPVLTQEAKIDLKWFETQLTTSNNRLLDAIEDSDLQRYQDQVKAEFTKSNNDSTSNLWNKLELEWLFAGQVFSGANANKNLVSAIKAKLNNHSDPNWNRGFWYLWTGTTQDTKGKRIRARLRVKTQFEAQVQLVKPNGDLIVKEEEHSRDVGATIRTKFDVKPFLDALATQKISITQGSAVGQIQSIQMPSLDSTQVSQPWNQDYNDNKTMFAAVGGEFLFQAQDHNGNWSGSWIANDFNQIKTYNPSDPKIKLKAWISAGWTNSALYYGGDAIVDQASGFGQNGVEIALKVPKLISAPGDFAVQVQEQVTKTKPFGGNTYQLDISNISLFEEALVNMLKTHSDPNQSGTHNNIGSYLSFEYQLGDGEWKRAAQLQKDLSSNNQSDEKSNQIRMRILLSAPNAGIDPEFVLSDQLKSQTFEIHSANNTVVKIFLHGLAEQYLNDIKVFGERNNLTYGVGSALEPFNGKYSDTQLNLEWSYGTADGGQPDHQANSWTSTINHPLPSKLTDDHLNDRYIFVRIKHNENDNIYEYGPEGGKTGSWTIGRIDLTNIQFLIKVNQKWFQEIQFSSSEIDLLSLNEQVINNWKNQIWQRTNVPNNLKSKVDIEFNIAFASNESTEWMDAKAMFETIKRAVKDFNNTLHYGIISLWNGQTPLANNLATTFISAKFVKRNAKDAISFVDSNDAIINQDEKLMGVANTANISTTIDISKYMDIVQQQDAEIQLRDGIVGTIAPNSLVLAPNPRGSWLFSNQNFLVIKQILEKHHVSFEFSADSQSGAAQTWLSYNDVRTYDPNRAKLAVALVNNSDNVKIQWSNHKIINPGADQKHDPIEIRLNAPKQVTIEQSDFDNLTSAFSGDTKNLTLNWTILDKRIEEIRKRHVTNSNNPEFEHIPLGIEIKIGNEPWQDYKTIVDYLKAKTTDLEARTISIRFKLTEADNNWIWGSTSAGETQIANDNDSPLKIFINDLGIFETIRRETKLQGDNKNFGWLWPRGWSVDSTSGAFKANSIGKGLKFQFSFAPSLSATEATTGTDVYQYWVDNYPTAFDLAKLDPNNPQVFIRIVTTDANKYTYEKAPQQANDKISLSLTLLSFVLNLRSDWTKQIQPSGTLSNLHLDESLFNQAILGANILPVGQTDLIEPQYSIDDQAWYSKAAFTKLLQTNNGAKDKNQWILRHQDVKVRFHLNSKYDAKRYILNIDGTNISTENHKTNQFDLFEPSKINQVKGVINADKLVGFVKANFHIVGSNTKPRFLVKNRATLDSLISQYASERLFDIQYSNAWDDLNNRFDWSGNNSGSLLKPDRSGLIGEDQLNLVINNHRKFAIRLVSENAAYQVEQNNAVQPEGYQIDISDNVKILIEITNPFTSNQKTLQIWTRDAQNRAKWMQGQGQFRIVVGEAGGQIMGPITDATAFLDQMLDPLLKDKVELVYRIFENEPDPQTIAQAQSAAAINDYETGGWIAFDATTTQVLEHEVWSKQLKLQVGHFLMVALRVKQPFATGPEAYQMENGDHSVLIPVSGTGATKQTPGRAAGFKVDPTRVPISATTTRLRSLSKATKSLLDGQVALDTIGLTNDAYNTAAGIKLTAQLYSEFYEDGAGQILVAGNGSKLVKRQTTQDGMIQGAAYVDATGQPIKDATGQVVYLYIDPQTGHLSKPLQSSKPTATLSLTPLKPGLFRVEPPQDDQEQIRQTLFKNQRIAITYEALDDKSATGLPDFELTQAQTVDLQTLISPQIKFPVENPQNVIYDYDNRDEFTESNIEYAAVSGNDKPINGAARVNTILKLKRTSKATGSSSTIITGADVFAAVRAITTQVHNDFGGQIQFKYTHTQSTGGAYEISNSADFYKIETLKNGDQIRLALVATDPDLVFLEAPEDLVITISDLPVDAPNQTLLQHLRVEQSGTENGRGSFRVLVNDPKQPSQDPGVLLKGWKFLVRAWSGRTRQIKIHWTDDQSRIEGLENGDKLEWKLVDEKNQPVQEAYYNTIAGAHQLDADGNLKLQFEQVNYTNGPEAKVVVANGIGDYPPKAEADQFPETSGFVIGGLQDRLVRFDLTQLAFEKIIATLEPHYKGRNGHGVLNFAERFFQGNWWVNHAGEVYQVPAGYSIRPQAGDPEQPEAITLEQFLAHTTFYTANPATAPEQLGWQFSSNATAIDNRLSNGNQLWARFDVAQPVEQLTFGAQAQRLGEIKPVAGYSQGFLIANLPPVANLTKTPDPMSPLWWILVALGTVLTLGGLTIFLANQRHKKLKIPKF